MLNLVGSGQGRQFLLGVNKSAPTLQRDATQFTNSGQDATLTAPKQTGPGADDTGIDVGPHVLGQMIDPDRVRLGMRRSVRHGGHNAKVIGHTDAVEKVFRAETPAAPGELFEIVNDLSTFPRWIEVVHNVDQAESLETTGPDGSSFEPTWWVTLRAQLGPLARSKRLRMRRAVSIPPTGDDNGLVRFERAETDGRDHAEWTMEVTVGANASSEPNGDQSWARCRLYYGGAMWTKLLEGQLDTVADRSTDRLRALASTLDQKG